MTLEWLEWPFYDKFSLLQTAFQQLSYIYCIVYSLFTHVTNGDVRRRTVIRRIFGIRKKLRIFRRRCIVGTLTIKANIPPVFQKKPSPQTLAVFWSQLKGDKGLINPKYYTVFQKTKPLNFGSNFVKS